ncbi:MAG: hypothetical protein WAK11_14650 [Candidatus Cybelea sp.]
MSALRLNHYMLGVITAIAFAGCGGQVAPTGGAPQSLAPAMHGKSWTLPETPGEDLLYIAGGSDDVYVYSYPQLKEVGKLTGLGNINVEGLCVDSKGDVFVPGWTASASYIYEFSHGGTVPKATLNDPAPEAASCSVDPTTGNLAVASLQGVEIYQNAQGTPTAYVVPNLDPYWVAYDKDGDLFVDGYSEVSTQPIAELVKGGSGFKDVTLNRKFPMFSLQWNNGFLTIVSGTFRYRNVEYIYRVRMSGYSGAIVGTTTLKTRHLEYDGNGQVWIQGNRVMGAGPRHFSLATWRYPSGGKVLKTIVRDFTPWGVVISVAPSEPRIHK